MNISSRCEYGCRAVLELARREHADGPVSSSIIAENRAIPEKYLVHILLQLKRAEIVDSVRGPKGGYLLARSPEKISLKDIIQAVDGPVLGQLPVDGRGSEDLRVAWEALAPEVEQVFSDVTVQGLIDQTSQSDMYYI